MLVDRFRMKQIQLQQITSAPPPRSHLGAAPKQLALGLLVTQRHLVEVVRVVYHLARELSH